MKRVERRQSHLERNVGSVSIEAERLLDLIERVFPDMPVQAESGDYSFESGRDIRNNIATFAGNPTVRCGAVQIIFKDGKCKITNNWRGTEGQAEIDTIYNELQSHKSLIDHLRDWRRIFTTIAGIVVGLIVFAKFPSYFSLTQYDIVNILLVLIVAQASFSVFQDIVYLRKRRAVYYLPSQPFWSRHFETIIVGIVGPILGAFITYLLTRSGS
ncbi:hypothetical protein SAMN02982922_3953 [Mesorhizobium australicum]|uniref:Uncharacterized protein n=2 Tax=Mesorhizobium australicum TaxID=536018 RepID=A0A1X7PFE2_9HYPH|nr:hypothetical protein SAMN02982922_3953 [Mesorhizobium australicum]